MATTLPDCESESHPDQVFQIQLYMTENRSQVSNGSDDGDGVDHVVLCHEVGGWNSWFPMLFNYDGYVMIVWGFFIMCVFKPLRLLKTALPSVQSSYLYSGLTLQAYYLYSPLTCIKK